MSRRTAFAWARLLTAAVCVTALTHRWMWAHGSQTVASQNFLAYLTIQSNIAFAALAVVAAIVAFRRREDPRWLTNARGIVLSWTITAGLAFGLIVWQAGARDIPISVPWSDIVLHFVLPGWTVLAWIVGPGRRSASWKIIPLVLAFPMLWGVFTLWRGHRIGWYPYYFLDIRQVSGWPELVISCAVALAIFTVVAASLVMLSRWHTVASEVQDAASSGAKRRKDARTAS